MIAEAQKVKNGLFIPMVEPFPKSSSNKIWVEIEWLEQKALEQKHLEGYLHHPVEPGEFSDLEEEQVWPPLTHSPQSFTTGKPEHVQDVFADVRGEVKYHDDLLKPETDEWGDQ